MKHSISPLYVFFGILFTSCLLISNIVSIKLISLGPWTVTAGIILFPVSYIINDVISEIWGYKKARFIIWCGFTMNLLAIIVYTVSVAMPASAFWKGQAGFAEVLQSTPRLAISSLIAYLAGSFINSMVMSKMKVKSQGKNFSLRAIVSTILGESCDSILFITIAFAGTVPIAILLQMVVIQIVLKTLYEILVLPLTIQVVKYVRRYEMKILMMKVFRTTRLKLPRYERKQSFGSVFGRSGFYNLPVLGKKKIYQCRSCCLQLRTAPCERVKSSILHC